MFAVFEIAVKAARLSSVKWVSLSISVHRSVAQHCAGRHCDEGKSSYLEGVDIVHGPLDLLFADQPQLGVLDRERKYPSLHHVTADFLQGTVIHQGISTP